MVGLLIRSGFDMSDSMKKTPQAPVQTDDVTVQQQLKKILENPARRKPVYQLVSILIMAHIRK